MDEKVKKIANLLDDKHAKDIEIFEVGQAHPMFDDVIVASVDVDRNLDAIISGFKELEKKKEIEVKSYDLNSREWVLIDLNDILVHVFIKDARAFYDVESILEEYVKNNQ